MKQVEKIGENLVKIEISSRSKLGHNFSKSYSTENILDKSAYIIYVYQSALLVVNSFYKLKAGNTLILVLPSLIHNWLDFHFVRLPLFFMTFDIEISTNTSTLDILSFSVTKQVSGHHMVLVPHHVCCVICEVNSRQTIK